MTDKKGTGAREQGRGKACALALRYRQWIGLGGWRNSLVTRHPLRLPIRVGAGSERSEGRKEGERTDGDKGIVSTHTQHIVGITCLVRIN